MKAIFSPVDILGRRALSLTTKVLCCEFASVSECSVLFSTEGIKSNLGELAARRHEGKAL